MKEYLCVYIYPFVENFNLVVYSDSEYNAKIKFGSFIEETYGIVCDNLEDIICLSIFEIETMDRI